MKTHIEIMAVGGTSFDVHAGDKYLGRVEFGSIDDQWQYIQDDDEIVEYVRKTFGLDAAIPAIVR